MADGSVAQSAKDHAWRRREGPARDWRESLSGPVAQLPFETTTASLRSRRE